jgi:cyclopropane-fatty-acyl-phospholipid synthase
MQAKTQEETHRQQGRGAIDLAKFRDIPFIKRTHCVLCGEKFAEPVISFPDFPLTEIYVAEKATEKLAVVDQAFCLCDNCGHAQLANVIAPEILYGDNYVTRTSSSRSASEAIDVFLRFVEPRISDKRLNTIVEIGCNDLYMLKRLRNRADRLYGIDPIWKGREQNANDDRIDVIGDFIENIDLGALDIKPDVLLCSHTLEHIENPKRLIQSLLDNGADKTLFFFQFPGLEPFVQTSRFDQLHHQHLNYFSLKSVVFMLEDVGAELVDFAYNHGHWGALMIAFRKKKADSPNPYHKFADSLIRITRKQVIERYKLFRDCMNVANARIASFKDAGPIYGYGAALMLPLLGYYVEELTGLRCILDDDTSKQGLYYINVPLKIVPPDSIDNLADSTVVVTAINSKQVVRAITSRLIGLNVRDIIIPINLI